MKVKLNSKKLLGLRLADSGAKAGQKGAAPDISNGPSAMAGVKGGAAGT